MKYVKVRLLSDGGYDSLKSIQFPVVVDGYIDDEDSNLVYVETKTLLDLTESAHGSDYPFNIVYECEIINKTETPEDKEEFDAMSESEWNGEFIPPVGVECWINWRFKPPVKAKFTYIGKGVLCYETDSGEFSTAIDQIDFCSPIETPQQREKREAVENLRDAIQRCEDVGAAVYYGNELTVGAVIEGNSTSLVKG